MPSNNTGDQDRKQSHRVSVWRGEKPMVALDQNGAVQLFPLRLRPDYLPGPIPCCGIVQRVLLRSATTRPRQRFSCRG